VEANVNLKERLRHLAFTSANDRRFGRTTLVAKLVKEADGVMLAHNHDYARDLQRKFGVTAKSIDLNLQGINGPFFFDHFAIETLLLRAANKIEEVEKENEELKQVIENAKKALGVLDGRSSNGF
jgi:hypothetical protein